MAASANDLLIKTGEGTATTLSSPGYTIGNTSITVVSTTNWPTDTGVIFSIDTAEIVNGDQVQVAGTYCEFEGVVSGATSITNVSLVSGTPQNYAAGALTRVYITLSSEVQNRMVDGLLVSHTQTGAMIPSLPLTTPKITTSINDANGNEVIVTPATASAVNELTVTNAATAAEPPTSAPSATSPSSPAPPSISATGSDTNITLAITPKGTGKAFIDSLSQWQRGTGAWTYVSATTFTVPQAAADAITKGTKLWFTQTTSKYWYVASISGTTVTIIPNSDYTLANAAITAPYYSNAATPKGFPEFFNYTAALTNVSGGTVNLSRFSVVGTRVFVDYRYTLAGAGVTGSISVGSPIACDSTFHAGDAPIGTGYILDAAIQVYVGVPTITSSTITLRPSNSAATNTAYGAATSSTARG